MIDRIREFFGKSFGENASPKRTVDWSRMIPDPNRMVAGFQFSLHLSNSAGNFHELAQEVQTVLMDEFKEKGLSQNEEGIPLDSPFLPEIIAQLRSLKVDVPDFNASVRLRFNLQLDALPGWEWFRFSGYHDAQIDWQKFECRADRIPSKIHWDQGGFMSEKLRQVIEAEQLTGLEFVKVCDVGRRKGPPWYYALAKYPLGRGLDHPLFDPVRGAEVWGDGKLHRPELRGGVYNFNNTHFRLDVASGDPILEAWLKSFPDGDIHVRSFPQILRSFIPKTDFAYMWDAALPSTLCCNRRARDLIVKGGFLSEKDFAPIWIWDTPPNGAEILDDPQKPCRPAYPLSDEKWQRVLKRVAEMENNAKHQPEPVRNFSTEEIFARLLADRDKFIHYIRTSDQALAARQLAELRAVFPGLPKLWERVLACANGLVFEIEIAPGGGRCSFDATSVAQLPETHKFFEEALRYVSPDAPAHLLHFATESCGDWLAFDLDSLTPEGDCKVLEFSHESMSVSREWPSILHLLDDALEMAGQPEDED